MAPHSAKIVISIEYFVEICIVRGKKRNMCADMCFGKKGERKQKKFLPLWIRMERTRKKRQPTPMTCLAVLPEKQKQEGKIFPIPMTPTITGNR